MQAQNTSLQKVSGRHGYIWLLQKAVVLYSMYLLPDDNENPSANPTVDVIAYGSTLETTATIANSESALQGSSFLPKQQR